MAQVHATCEAARAAIKCSSLTTPYSMRCFSATVATIIPKWGFSARVQVGAFADERPAVVRPGPWDSVCRHRQSCSGAPIPVIADGSMRLSPERAEANPAEFGAEGGRVQEAPLRGREAPVGTRSAPQRPLDAACASLWRRPSSRRRGCHAGTIRKIPRLDRCRGKTRLWSLDTSGGASELRLPNCEPLPNDCGSFGRLDA